MRLSLLFGFITTFFLHNALSAQFDQTKMVSIEESILFLEGSCEAFKTILFKDKSSNALLFEKIENLQYKLASIQTQLSQTTKKNHTGFLAEVNQQLLAIARDLHALLLSYFSKPAKSPSPPTLAAYQSAISYCLKYR